MRAAMIGRGIGWLLAVLLCAVLFFITGSVWLPVIGGALILLPAAAALWNRLACRRPEAAVELPSGTRKNRAVSGRIGACFDGFPPMGRVFGTLTLINDLTGETAELRVPMEAGPRGYEAAFTVTTAHCGRIRAVAERITVTDPIGFLPRSFSVAAEGRMTVLPETFPVALDARPLAVSLNGEDAMSDRRGTDRTETFQLREYQAGDDLHGVHWKLSGKMGRLIYREASQQVSRSLLLYWDQSQGTPEQLDALAEALFSVGQSLCQAGVPYTVGRSEFSAVHTAEISDMDGLIGTFPLLLRRRGPEPPETAALTAFGRVFYFTSVLPPDGGEETVRIFLCGEETAEADNVTAFTPENAAAVLEHI